MIHVLQEFVSISFWPSGTISNACIMFVDQFRQSVDLYSSPNSRLVIKTEYKEIEKTLAHIYTDFVKMYTYNDFRLYRLLIPVLVYVYNLGLWLHYIHVTRS